MLVVQAFVALSCFCPDLVGGGRGQPAAAKDTFKKLYLSFAEA